MYLKKIELNGFKSFANKTEFPINQGITAIVGPNGSGKSNIIDGIKWVLGEQSVKSLRGSKMEDIIFAGSEGRKRKNYAEVSLVFDNSEGKLNLDYSEVSVTRRIFRDGESEYYINKSNCRLKDIHELFMDTGVGKEAYSIISQGQVEEILNSRPEEKRIIFEEAAGIVKYKNKKKESLKKLEETEQNLVRVDDILFQLEQDLPDVQQDASKAENYRQIKERLKKLEVSLMLEKINELNRQYSDIDKQIEEKKQLQVEVDKAISLTHQTKNQLSVSQREMEHQRNILRDKELEIMKSLEELKYCFQLNKQQATEAKKRIEGLSFENMELEGYLKDNDTKKQGIETKIVQSQQEMRINKEELVKDEKCSKKLLLELENIKEQLDNSKEEIISIIGNVASIKNEIKNLENNKVRLISDQSRKERELENLIQKSVAVNNRVELLVGLAAKLEQEFKVKEAIKTSLDGEMKNLHININAIKDEITLKNNKINELTSKINGLTNLEEAFAGYNQGPKEVLKKFNDSAKLEGSIAQIINVPSQLTTAIEIALGSGLQNIVVADEEFASEIIDYLRTKRLGRATLLPLNIVNGSVLEISDPEIIGIASKLISYHSRFQGVIDFLLGRIIIVKNLEIGHSIAKKYRYKYRIVTLEGDVINSGGAITGGRYNTKSSGILQRGLEIEELTKVRTIELEILEKLRRNLETVTLKETKINKQVEKALTELADIREQKNSANQQLMLAKHEFKTLQDHIALVEHEKKLFDNDLKDMEEKLKHSEDLYQKKLAQQEQISLLINKTNDDLLEKTDYYEAFKSKIVRKQITIASLEQEVYSMSKELAMLQEEGKRTSKRLLSNKENIENNLMEKLRLEKEMEVYTKEQLRLEEVKLETIDKQSKTNSAKRGIDEKLEAAYEKLKELEQSKDLLSSKINSINLKKSKLLIEMDSLTERLLSEYFLTVGEAKALEFPAVSEKDAIREINMLREDLKGLGEVNLGAIEEYKKIIGKINFLNEQKSDLNKAKLDLRKIILEMDCQMASQFEESFEKIKVFFNEVFQKLFNGGRGYLRLTEPDNILESGVEIFVQPPGKKLQSMTLLSGGEKALTAIVLLFAILKTRPSPFCVLDEIEASLDEANVDRFGAFLKEMAHESQFIVVTHRKGTMECADILYGITMEENGISKQISVNLDKKVG